MSEVTGKGVPPAPRLEHEDPPGKGGGVWAVIAIVLVAFVTIAIFTLCSGVDNAIQRGY